MCCNGFAITAASAEPFTFVALDAIIYGAPDEAFPPYETLIDTIKARTEMFGADDMHAVEISVGPDDVGAFRYARAMNRALYPSQPRPGCSLGLIAR
ncbi:hypothetical protein [Litoreibacter roseus]|uniref:Uncharacterized protein n=1 Tax=Litoreibacter roseus TaxID=2601869 RepID=A0A6N6JCQ1_9RHOB|nr:hypothetical protein [Litoreibacter roseus]GFE63108.1 hypothetical protein KIN_01820 [Litoreibacter roseus]